MALTVDELRALFPTEASGGFELDTGRLSWRLAAARTTPISLRQSPPAVPLSRWNDSAPFYAGAALGPANGSFAHCTSGVPAISTVDSRQWLVTPRTPATRPGSTTAPTSGEASLGVARAPDEA